MELGGAARKKLTIVRRGKGPFNHTDPRNVVAQNYTEVKNLCQSNNSCMDKDKFSDLNEMDERDSSGKHSGASRRSNMLSGFSSMSRSSAGVSSRGGLSGFSSSAAPSVGNGPFGSYFSKAGLSGFSESAQSATNEESATRKRGKLSNIDVVSIEEEVESNTNEKD